MAEKKDNVSRQRSNQKRLRADHRCIICGQPAAVSTRKGAGGFSQHCLPHMIAWREYIRERRGSVRRLNSASYRLEETNKGIERQ